MPDRAPTHPDPEPPPAAARPFELFVSYSHANESVKDRLLIHPQGSRNQATSARSFLLATLAELEGPEGTGPDDADPEGPGAPPPSDYDLGERLARTAARAPDGAPRVLLLDGLEPLQQPSEDPRLNGSVKDQGLLGLLETLAREPGNAL